MPPINPTAKGHGAPKSHRATQSPSNPFKANSPTKTNSRVQTRQITRPSAPGKQLTPITDGKHEYRFNADKRQGFAGISKKYREDGRGVKKVKIYPQ